MERIMIDLGSATAKVYKANNQKAILTDQKSIHFKDGFTPEHGFSEQTKQELITYLKKIKTDNPNMPINLYATAIYRKMNPETQTKLINSVFDNTGLYLNIIGHELEGFHLEQALVANCKLDEKMLLINIGGGSTELVIIENKKPIDKYNLDIGVMSICSKFPNINNEFSESSLEETKSYILEKLPTIPHKTRVAFYSGGELSYMKRASYPIEQNNLFEDELHPYLISTKNFAKKNNDIFSNIKLSELESKMPHDPKWMHGARPCSAISQAICEKYEVESIIPSDANLIDGIVKQELQKATLSGDFIKNISYIEQIKNKLLNQNIFVLSSQSSESKSNNFDYISQSDAIIICNPNGAVDSRSLIEIELAKSLNKRIIFTEKPIELALQTLPAEIGLPFISK